MTVAMSFVASFGYAAPVWNFASPESFAAASSASAAPASAVEEREAVLRVVERLVERLLGHADVTQQRLLLRRVVDAADDERALRRPRAS